MCYSFFFFLRFVEFGQIDSFHEIVCASKSEICVWNLMTLQLSWKISIDTLFLVQDSLSSYFAVFTTNNSGM